MIVFLWAACTPAPTLVTSELPIARIGELYTASIEALEGRDPLTFTAAGLPSPLAMNPGLGIVSGVPREAGTFDVTIEVADRRGERAMATLPLTVEAARDGCGKTYRGIFTESAGFFDIDWDMRRGWATRSFVVPSDEIDRMTFVPTGSITMRLVQPGISLVAEGDVAQQADFIEGFLSTGSPRELDHTTDPHLGAFQAVSAPATLLVASPFTPGAWEVSTVCTAGPIVEPAALGPYREGDLVRASFRDIEPQADTRVEALDAIPPGLELSDVGFLSGVATAGGEYAFALRATRPDGAERVSAAGVSVYTPVDVGCGETVPFSTVQGRLVDDGDVFGPDQDVDAFAVVEADWGDHAALTFTVTFDGGPGDVGALDPNLVPAVPSAAVERWVGEVVTVDLSPNVWPTTRFYQGWQRARLSLSHDDRAVSGTVSLVCDDGPRPDFLALPVLTPGMPESWALDAVGGTPPYTWAAEGLPASVTLDEAGTLSSDGTDFGSVDVPLTVSDADGPGTPLTAPLWSSAAEACGPDAIVLTCTEDGRIATGTFADDSTPQLCVAPDDVMASDWIFVRVTGDRFVQIEQRRFPDRDVFTTLGSLATLRRGLNTLTGLENHDGLPYGFSLLESSKSAERLWRVCVACGTGPTPSAIPDECTTL